MSTDPWKIIHLASLDDIDITDCIADGERKPAIIDRISQYIFKVCVPTRWPGSEITAWGKDILGQKCCIIWGSGDDRLLGKGNFQSCREGREPSNFVHIGISANPEDQPR